MDIFNKQYTLNEWVNHKRDRVINLFLEHEYGFCPLGENEIIEYKEISTINISNLISKKQPQIKELKKCVTSINLWPHSPLKD